MLENRMRSASEETESKSGQRGVGHGISRSSAPLSSSMLLSDLAAVNVTVDSSAAPASSLPAAPRRCQGVIPSTVSPCHPHRV